MVPGVHKLLVVPIPCTLNIHEYNHSQLLHAHICSLSDSFSCSQLSRDLLSSNLSSSISLSASVNYEGEGEGIQSVLATYVDDI